MNTNLDDFEKAIDQLETQIERVRRLTREQGIDRSPEIEELQDRVQTLLRERYTNPSAWDRTRIARNARRPSTLDYARLVFQEFMELHGDRHTADDGAVVGGVARLGERWVLLIGHQKGRDAAERHRRNFGYARPAGYRKARRLMRMAEKFGRPIVCLVDTPAADPSVPSEEHGISEAIACNLREMFLLRVPVVIAVTGEGGSGGALGIGVGDRVLILEHAVYSVCPPEGCAAILWRDPERGEEAAEALKLTAPDALRLGVVDEILPEPPGGAHRDFDRVSRTLREALDRHLDELCALAPKELLERRYARFRRIGICEEEPAPAPPRGDQAATT